MAALRSNECVWRFTQRSLGFQLDIRFRIAGPLPVNSAFFAATLEGEKQACWDSFAGQVSTDDARKAHLYPTRHCAKSCAATLQVAPLSTNHSLPMAI